MHSGLWAICEKTWRNMERKREDDRTEWLVFITFIDIDRKQSANLKKHSDGPVVNTKKLRKFSHVKKTTVKHC